MDFQLAEQLLIIKKLNVANNWISYQEVAKQERIVAIEREKAEGAQGNPKVFKQFTNFIAILRKTYDGGTVTAMRCVCRNTLGFYQGEIEMIDEDNKHLHPFEGEKVFCREDSIANFDPSFVTYLTGQKAC